MNNTIEDIKARLATLVTVPEDASPEDIKALARKTWAIDGEFGRRIKAGEEIPTGLTDEEIAETKAKDGKRDRATAILITLATLMHRAEVYVPHRAEPVRPIGRAELVNLLAVDGVILADGAADSEVKAAARVQWGKGDEHRFAQGYAIAGITADKPDVASRMRGGNTFPQAAAAHLRQMCESAGLNSELPLAD